MTTALITLVVALAVLAASAATALLVTSRRLRDTRLELAAVRESLVEVVPPDGVGVLAGRALRAVTTTATRLRSDGIKAMLRSSLTDLDRWVSEDRTRIVRVAADDGTVTVMFTDIENSTPLNEGLGDDRWLRVLAAQERVVRTAVTEHDGIVVKNQGDGFMVVFGDPRRAVDAAAAIEHSITSPRSRVLRRSPIQVRIGLHRGEVVNRNGDFFGRSVAVAARVADQAGGGEVLVSGPVADELGEADRLEPVGTRELKGLSEPVDLYRVDWRRHPGR